MSNPSRQLRHARRPIIQEVAMRKITAGLFVSLDGVAEAHDGWHFPFLTEEWQRLIAARLPQADAVLLGRRTFVEFTRVWPPQGTDTPMAAFMNTTRKYVVSTTLDDVDALGWANSTLLTGDLVEELTRLKQQPGGDIILLGSPSLVPRSEEHTSELQSREKIVCRLLLEKKK